MNLIQFHSSDSDFGGVTVEQKAKVTPKDAPPQATTTQAKIVPITSSVSPWMSGIAYPVGRNIVLPLYFRNIEVIGREHLPKEGSIILAPTHRSRWDAFMVPYAAGRDITGRDLRFMVSADEMKGLQGWVIRNFGGFPVDPKHPGVGTIRHSVELLRSGHTLVIFPEGNIYRTDEVQPLKGGLGRMALQTQVSQPELDLKVLPISIKYSQPIPQWGCDVKVRIGKPLQVSNYATTSTKQGAKKLTADLEAALKYVHETDVKVVTLSQPNQQAEVEQC